MSERKRILLTNDDGIFSDGINALYKELSRKHDVKVFAPDREQSASSHSLTLNHPLRVQHLDKDRYTTDGTPTDCVMLAIHLVYKNKLPDMIISGINHGPNMGDDITYSGTVAAAIEGAILEVPSIAVSMSAYRHGMPFQRAAKFTMKLISKYDQLGIDKRVFLNVNFPPDNGKAYSKVSFTEQGFRKYKDVIISKTDPRGRPYYWIGGRPKWKSTRGSDFNAVQSGAVSITPMKLAFTDSEALGRLKSKEIFKGKP